MDNIDKELEYSSWMKVNIFSKYTHDPIVFTFQVCVGDWLPTSVFGYLHALCAYLRMIYVALYLVFFSGVEYDVVFCDQVSCVIQELTTCLLGLLASSEPFVSHYCLCCLENRFHCQQWSVSLYVPLVSHPCNIPWSRHSPANLYRFVFHTNTPRYYYISLAHNSIAEKNHYSERLRGSVTP